jgi:Domain of unknown function (DUF222)/HNH endonuclease
VAIPDPASTAEAMDMVLTGLRHLTAADPTAMASRAQAECLQTLEQADAMSAAARAWLLAAFTNAQGYSEDADYSPTAWLIHRTKVTKGAARGHVAWSRRTITHPQVVAALAEGTVLSESMARTICGWTDRLPGECRLPADEILIAAARAGASKEDLAGLAAEIYIRSLPEDDDQEQSFEDRRVRVETTFAGAGVLTGDLTPECAAVVTAVLESLSGPVGAEAACEVHHVKHIAHGGPTSLTDCALLCSYHHQIVIHRWGWTLVLNPDGTTTAWNPDRTKVLHSHSPPARAG